VASQISLIENPVIDQHLSREQQVWRLRSTLLHELGHALGLEHSLCPEHVMYFRGWRNTYLSSGDALAIQKLYPSFV
jgi:predicted Zn-dependent protease